MSSKLENFLVSLKKSLDVLCCEITSGIEYVTIKVGKIFVNFLVVLLEVDSKLILLMSREEVVSDKFSVLWQTFSLIWSISVWIERAYVCRDSLWIWMRYDFQECAWSTMFWSPESSKVVVNQTLSGLIHICVQFGINAKLYNSKWI